ncbi:hypothetical protein [Propionibacterium australiense]|uniref:Uncharacterized protein n=1 Tax=Propionibacterium australiense TaxID=119981 RepID=A0A383S7W5_9ACTN|nr:hypothetical protein [Propionibacterium australiense]RLP06771.1 hypothetical protein D9T14_11350 [Propionibacterium australiense]RLP06937.1 hypothetical protein D7U36_11850 [Propionibacterium australiense]SYZ34068.1 Hypothetical protein PROPAUS_2044 [Propionibacterium australiense]VEH92122.1 Uncharacterised protein [Propionibacterium australiense]
MSELPQDTPADQGEGAPEPGNPAGRQPPVTGNRLVDEVLAGLGDLDELPVGERLERLTAAQQGLAEILDGTRAQLPPHGEQA